MTKVPDYIRIEGTGDNVAVSFGRNRLHKLRYTQTVNEYGHIELERDIETDKPVKEPLKIVRFRDQMQNAECATCTKLSSKHPIDVDTGKELCLMDWIHADYKYPLLARLVLQRSGKWENLQETVLPHIVKPWVLHDKRIFRNLREKENGKKPSRATPKTKHKTKTELKTAVVTYRDAAKALIRGEVENGADIQTLKSRQPGYSCDKYEAQVGGWANQKKYSSDKIIVTELRGRKLKPAAIFSLIEIYNEIKKSSGAPDDKALQLKEEMVSGKNCDKDAACAVCSLRNRCKRYLSSSPRHSGDDEKPLKEPLTVTAVKRKREILPGRVQTSANAHQYLDCKGCKLDTSIHPQGDEGQLCLKDWLVHGYPDPNNPVDTNVDYTYDKIKKIYVKDD
jgi:hypothetical protein